MFGQSPFKAIVFGPPPSNDPEDLIGSRKRKSEHTQENDIARFKRVRVLSKQTRVRRSKPGPDPFMRFATESKGFNAIAMGQAHERTESKAGQTIPQAPPAKALAQVPSRPTHPPPFEIILRPPATETSSDDESKTVGKTPHTENTSDEVDVRPHHHNTDKHNASNFDQDLEYRSIDENRLKLLPESKDGKVYKNDYS